MLDSAAPTYADELASEFVIVAACESAEAVALGVIPKSKVTDDILRTAAKTDEYSVYLEEC